MIWSKERCERMRNEIILESILRAKEEINSLRARFTQFRLPLADAKLVSVCDYLGKEAAKVEARIWQEADL